MEIHKTLATILLIALAASLGSCLRFYLVRKLSISGFAKHWPILLINSSSCFGLGFFASLENNMETHPMSNYLNIFLAIGFCGSFSTFSSFVWELSLHVRHKNWFDILLILLTAIFGGLIFAQAGYRLGNHW